MITAHVLHVPGANAERDAIVQHLIEEQDDSFNVCVHEDPDRRGLMVNWIEALHCASDDGNSWSLVLQDDAMPLPGWKEHLEQALWHCPTVVLGLSHFGQATSTGARRGAPYLVGPHLIWGAAVAYRNVFLGGLAPFAEMVYARTQYPHDDRLISAYAQRVGKKTAVTTMALFDQPVAESTIGHTGAGGDRRPRITIQTHGRYLRWANKPNHVIKSTGGAPEQREWLARLGTKSEITEYRFEVARKGAVRKVLA
jgi:hypothetical protein